MGPGSESQQRKRKAPGPPPTPLSITPGLDDASTSATPTPDSHATDASTPALRTTAMQSATVSTKTATQPTPATPISSSASSSSTTFDSLAVQDSSSELSHCLDDSDADPGTTSSSTAGAQVQLAVTSSAPSTSVEHSEQASSTADQTDQEVASTRSKSETEATLKLRLEDVENNRQSAIGKYLWYDLIWWWTDAVIMTSSKFQYKNPIQHNLIRTSCPNVILLTIWFFSTQTSR